MEMPGIKAGRLGEEESVSVCVCTRVCIHAHISGSFRVPSGTVWVGLPVEHPAEMLGGQLDIDSRSLRSQYKERETSPLHPW